MCLIKLLVFVVFDNVSLMSCAVKHGCILLKMTLNVFYIYYSDLS
jgi:hypothetical protein